VVGASPGDAPTCVLRFNPDWKPLLLGLIENLRTADMWSGSTAEVDQAEIDVEQLLYMVMAAEIEPEYFVLDESILDSVFVLA